MTTPTASYPQKPGGQGERPGSDSLPGLPWSSEANGNGLAVLTLVLWLVFSVVGALGFVWHYERPPPPAPPEPPIIAQQLQVELTRNPLPPHDPERTPDQLAEPSSPDALTQPVIVQPIAVAQPSPTIAFAVPVEGSKRIVDARRADYMVSPVTNAGLLSLAAPPAHPLVFGQGEGKQPAPEYPPTARRLGQEGTVLVRLAVGEDGRVLEAEATLASPWPLLNEAALRVVRERWRFSKGVPRTYEVRIRFEIVK